MVIETRSNRMIMFVGPLNRPDGRSLGGVTSGARCEDCSAARCTLSILDSVKEMLRSEQEPQELDIIDVVRHGGRLYVAGTFNRRLCMYRLLAMYAADRFGRRELLLQDMPSVPRSSWREKSQRQRAGPECILGSSVSPLDPAQLASEVQALTETRHFQLR